MFLGSALQNGVQEMPHLPGGLPGDRPLSCGCTSSLAQEDKLDPCRDKAEGERPHGFFPPCAELSLGSHLLSLLQAAPHIRDTLFLSMFVFLARRL